jgi:hypothetical protein
LEPAPPRSTEGPLAIRNGTGVIDVADWNDSDKLGKGKDMVDRLRGGIPDTILPDRPIV